MANHERSAAVFEILRHLHDLEALKRLIWSELNYQRAIPHCAVGGVRGLPLN